MSLWCHLITRAFNRDNKWPLKHTQNLCSCTVFENAIYVRSSMGVNVKWNTPQIQVSNAMHFPALYSWNRSFMWWACSMFSKVMNLFLLVKVQCNSAHSKCMGSDLTAQHRMRITHSWCELALQKCPYSHGWSAHRHEVGDQLCWNAAKYKKKCMSFNEWLFII